MRILDKNTDFYDFYQNVYRDDSVIFDRMDSFVVTKDMMCKYFEHYEYFYRNEDGHRFILLQVCNTFWLFGVKATEVDRWYIKNYKVSLIAKWKNYDKPRVLIQLDLISLPKKIISLICRDEKDKVYSIYGLSGKQVSMLMDTFNYNNYKVLYSVNRHIVFYGDGRREEKHIPLLKACGIGDCVDPLDIYLSFEEYFSLEKQDNERVESLGLTDIEKVENHGFDKKISFRGKV